MKVYTVEEVAAVLRLETKTVLRLIKRGHLKALPGIRHKRIPEAELERYLDVRGTLGSAAANARGGQRNGSGQSVVEGSGRSARVPGVDGGYKGPIVANPTAKAVAPPVAQSSQR